MDLAATPNQRELIRRAVQAMYDRHQLNHLANELTVYLVWANGFDGKGDRKIFVDVLEVSDDRPLDS